MDIPLSDRQGRHRPERPAPPSSREASTKSVSTTGNPIGLAGTPSSLADAEPLVHPNPNASQSKSNSKIKTALKTLKLNALVSLYRRLRNIPAQEEPKVALHKHHGYAILGALIHFLPVGASLALVFINTREIYIGGELIGTNGQDTPKLAALSFAAKLHELVMISSLTAIVLTYIRSNILCKDGLPLGALFAGQQFRQLSFFWSAEFWAAARHKAQRRYKGFVGLLVTATLLGVSLGPSTTQLMRPRLDDWPAGGTTFWLNAPNDTIFPTKLESSQAWDHCRIDTGDLSCPHGGWRILDSNYLSYFAGLGVQDTLPEQVLIEGALSQRYMNMRTRGDFESRYPLYRDAYTRATTPMSSIANSGAEIGKFWAYAAANYQRNKRFWSRKEAKYSIDAPQPAVATLCQSQTVSDQQISDEGLLFFPNLTSVVYPIGVTQTSATFYTVGVSDEELVSTVLSQVNSTREPSILWIEALDGFGSTAHAVAIFPSTSSSPTVNQVFSCSIDSRYVRGTTSSTRNRLKLSFSEKIEDYYQHGIINTDYPQISLSTSWTQYLNPTINSEGWTAFAQMSKSGGLWNVSSTPDDNFSMVVVEAILTTMTLNGIARADYNISLAGRPKGDGFIDPTDPGDDFYNQLLPVKYLGPGGEAYDITDEESETATKLVLHVFVNGYAYNHRSATQIAAMAVLLLYCLLAIFHFCHTAFMTKEQSNAWDTTPELFALAVNSSRTEALKNTGAGIETSNVFKEVVKVEVKADNRLEFVFHDTRDDTDTFYKNKHYA